MCEDIEHVVLAEERIISRRIYYTITEAKNGAGTMLIKGKNAGFISLKVFAIQLQDFDMFCMFLEDYLFHTPEDPHRSADCVKQRCEMIRKNLELLNSTYDK